MGSALKIIQSVEWSKVISDLKSGSIRSVSLKIKLHFVKFQTSYFDLKIARFFGHFRA